MSERKPAEPRAPEPEKEKEPQKDGGLVEVPGLPPAAQPKKVGEGRALGVAAIFAVAGILWIAHSVGIGVLLGMLTAFTLQPFYRRLANRWGRPALAALASIGVVTLVVGASVGGFGYLLIGRGINIVRSLLLALQPGGAARPMVERVNGLLTRLHVGRLDIGERLGNAAAEISVRLAAIATTIAGATFSMLLGLLFLMLTMYFVLQNWASLTRRAEIVLPLNPRDTHALFDELRRVGRTVLLGTVLTGLAQGLLAGLGYLVTKVPEPAFFGALTAVASLLPGLGTVLVWLPLGIYLILSGHVALGITELLYGVVVVVGFSDYVLRPWFVGRDGEMPALLTFIALFGGLETFGLVGLVSGPLIMSLALAVLRIYEREAARRRGLAEPAPVPPPPRPLGRLAGKKKRPSR